MKKWRDVGIKQCPEWNFSKKLISGGVGYVYSETENR